MEIIAVISSSALSDGRIRKEYRLSSPVVREVLEALSKGDHVYTGRQYLSPTYSIIKSEGFVISGILCSPVIMVTSPPGMSAGIEDYLFGFLSTIPDSEKPDSFLTRIRDAVRSLSVMAGLKNH